MNTFLYCLRIVAATTLVCVVGYTGVLLAIGQTIFRETAEGSLLRNEAGDIIGSRQIAQSFTMPGYFWPRLSAVDFDGGGAGGSNLAPTNPVLIERAQPVLAALGATLDNLAPADLVTASGGGLDPHISLAAARFQAPRVAEARGMDTVTVNTLIKEYAFSAGGFLAPGRIVNVLELNIALDDMPK